jgi:hypothetical protein
LSITAFAIIDYTGNTKGGSVTIDLLFDWFGLVCLANKNKKIFSCHTADSKPVKQVNGTVILPPLVFPGLLNDQCLVRNRLVIPEFEHNMMSLRGQASWAKMTSLRGKQTALVCHLTKFVNKAEWQTFFSTKIDNDLSHAECHDEPLPYS